jgi:hypothetical protein
MRSNAFLATLSGYVLWTLTSACGGAATGVADEGDNTLPAVRINEVVAYPNNDWSGAAAAYQAPPGTGTVSTLDEYIELHNFGDRAVDLTGWVIEMVGAETTTTELGESGTLVLSSGSSLVALQPQGFAVLGNPEGSLSTDVYIVLRDAEGELIDDVEIGGFIDSRDREGDGIGDGAPGAERNGFARGAFDEAVARPVDQPDTDEDAGDFVKMVATPLAPNTPRRVPVEFRPPQVVGAVEGQSFGVIDALWVALDESVDPASTDTSIAVTADGEPVALGFTTFVDNDRTIVINPIGRLPFDADIEVTVRGGPQGVTDLAGNPLQQDFVFAVHTEPAAVNPAPVVLNEICITPLQDWNDSSGGNKEAFSGLPGTGRVNSADEWVELLVISGEEQNVSGHSLQVYNGPNFFGPARLSTPLSGDDAEIRIIGDSQYLWAMQPGGRVIVGNPVGSLRIDTYVALRDDTSALVDAVEIGGLTAETDRGGDGLNNGAPEPGANGGAIDQSKEVIARVPDGVDSGNDGDDFVHTSATLGAPNE